jgi:Animal haem peroxidase
LDPDNGKSTALDRLPLQTFVGPRDKETSMSQPAEPPPEPPDGSSPSAFRMHGTEPLRGIRRVPLSPIHEGRFGRMFRRLPPAPVLPHDVLTDLANQMRDDDPPTGWNGTPQPRDNPRIPAGYTYLGQFIDHDITFDPVSSLQRQNDPDALHDFRSPRYDLDSMYGSGPADEPFQYDQATGGHSLLLEPNRQGVEDLPRNSQDVALIGDPRNDENTIVGQLHLVFLKLHNKLLAQVLADPAVPEDAKFEEAQRLARWHYQWVIAKDYLPRIAGQEVVDAILRVDPTSQVPEIITRFYRPKVNVYMPVEFSAAGFRFGHSQIRGVYDLNAQVTQRPIFVPGPLPDQFADLRGFRRLPPGWTIDWNLFFPIGGSTPQPSRLVDGRLVPALFDLPHAGGGSLPLRNLKRGQALGLPSGQDVARFVRAPQVLSGADLGGVPEPTPLWFYILKEAELLTGGQHLGPVGGRMVAEVLLGLLNGDPQSWISIDPRWQPTLPDADRDGQFTMSDLVVFATS